ncbi:hypothetical protein COJ96_02940 [Bacillus sp. AFS073361]|uniref:hypothetical protein n=1 Tax=Bacillus sp. AFS073361 TaxID=2033511 RepID=UPI000BFAAFF6|nr:hypothetical protein [Bacillus sp. AFS073361]PFP30932.1 hypothetical protein COJ96_02940 [Bacillus sp. AFS073361]
MQMNWKKRLLVGGLAVSLTFGGLAGCGDGVDQDNGISDGQQKDAVDTDTKKEANATMDDAKQNIEEAVNNVEEKLKEDGVGDGVDQDNGVSDGEKKDELDN